MSDREAPYRIVPPPVVDDGRGYRLVAKCPLCFRHLGDTATTWFKLPNDPDGLRRSVHSFCAHEYGKFLRTVGYAG